MLIITTLDIAIVRINRIIIYIIYYFSKSTLFITSNKDLNRIRIFNSVDLYINRQIRINWQEKYLLIVDEVNILGIRILYVVNK